MSDFDLGLLSKTVDMVEEHIGETYTGIFRNAIQQIESLTKERDMWKETALGHAMTIENMESSVAYGESKIIQLEKERDGVDGYKAQYFRGRVSNDKLKAEIERLQQAGLKQCGELAKAQRECEQLRESINGVCPQCGELKRHDCYAKRDAQELYEAQLAVSVALMRENKELKERDNA